MANRHVVFVPDAIRAYLDELKTMGLAAKTVSGQSGYVKRFGRICDEMAREQGKRSPLTMAELSTGVAARYFATSSGEQGNLNNMLVAVRKWLRWCEINELVPPNASARILAGRGNKKAVRKPKHYVPVSQFGTLLDIAGERHRSERAMMALALYTLGRRSEIAEMRLRDLDLEGQTLLVHRVKRKRWTEVSVGPELDDELRDWLGWYEQNAGLSQDSLIIPRLMPVYERVERGRLAVTGELEMIPSLPPSHPEYMVKRCLDVTGARTEDGRSVRHLGEGMHTIRRSGARAMLDHLSGDLGFDRAVLRVMTMLDHESPQQTLAYIGMDQERRELNEWLKTNSMYGTYQQPASNVLPLRRKVS